MTEHQVGLVLEITNDDIDPRTRGALESKARDLGHLGPDKALMDALPRAISKRVLQICPPEFEMSELTLKMLVKGTPFGVGIEGELLVKLAPKKG